MALEIFLRWKDREREMYRPGISRFLESGSYIEFLEQNKKPFEQDRLFQNKYEFLLESYFKEEKKKAVFFLLLFIGVFKEEYF